MCVCYIVLKPWLFTNIYLVVTLFDAAQWQMRIWVLVHCFGGGRREQGTDMEEIKKRNEDEGRK